MIYKGIEIIAEVATEHSIWSLHENGELKESKRYIDIEPEIVYWGIDDDETGLNEWFDSLEEAKQFIDNEVKQ